MEEGIRIFLEGILDGGDIPARDADELLASTPRRVASAFADDLLAGTGEDASRHLEPMTLHQAAGPVLLRDVRFTSVCAHHLLPYRGVAHIGFVPADRHVGLGGIARLVDSLGRRLTLQEPLTASIAEHMHAALAPRSVIVVLVAEHLCLSVRGARKTGHRLVSVERRGRRDETLETFAAGLGFPR